MVRYYGLDMSPRRVWTGLTVPGKKMMAMLMPGGGTQRGQSLINLYKDAPYQVLLTTAIALHTLPQQGAQFGPAFRDVGKPTQSLMLYGAILTDIRDFLKFRFRPTGSVKVPPSQTADQAIKEGNFNEALEGLETDESAAAVISYTIHHTIAALDELSRDTESSREAFEETIRRLRDNLRALVRLVYPEWYGGAEHYDNYIDPLFSDDAVR
jgi:hypothetical protein